MAGTTIVKKYNRAVKESADVSAHFHQFTEKIDPALRTKWEEDILAAERQREEQPDVMDIYAPKIKKAASRQEVELMLSEKELEADGPTGQAEWLSQGLKIEQTQLVIHP